MPGIFGRVGVVTVTVLVADLAVSAMNNHFRLFGLGGLRSGVDGGTLCSVIGRNPGISLSSHSPLSVMGDNVLIFPQR